MFVFSYQSLIETMHTSQLPTLDTSSTTESATWYAPNERTTCWYSLDLLLRVLLGDPLRAVRLPHCLVKSMEYATLKIWRSLGNGMSVPSWGKMEDTNDCPCLGMIMSPCLESWTPTISTRADLNLCSIYVTYSRTWIHALIILSTSSLSDMNKPSQIDLDSVICRPIPRWSSSLWIAL